MDYLFIYLTVNIIKYSDGRERLLIDVKILISCLLDAQTLLLIPRNQETNI